MTGAIRGAALHPFVCWYADVHGQDGLRRAVARLAEPDRRLFDARARGLGIQRYAWYPAPLIHQMLDGLLEGLDPAQRLALAETGAASEVESSLQGIVGIVFQLLVSPALCRQLGPQMWGAFYASGHVRIRAEGRRTHRMDVRDWRGHHGFLCQMNNAAGRGIYEAAGGRHVTTEHAACIDRGDPHCSYVIRW